MKHKLSDEILESKLSAIPHGRALLIIADKLRSGDKLSREDNQVLQEYDFRRLDPYFIELQASPVGVGNKGDTLIFRYSGFVLTLEGERTLQILKELPENKRGDPIAEIASS